MKASEIFYQITNSQNTLYFRQTRRTSSISVYVSATTMTIRAYRNALGVNTHVHAAYARMFIPGFIHNKSCVAIHYVVFSGIRRDRNFQTYKLRSLRDNLAPIMEAINLHSLQLLHNLGHFILFRDKVLKTVIG